MKPNPVVITGTGMVTSLGRTRAETWRALLAGRCGVGPIRGFDAAGFQCRVAAEAVNFSRSEAAHQSRQKTILDLPSYMLLQSARDAYQEARLERGSFAGEDIGFFMGMGMVDHDLGRVMPAVAHSVDGTGHFDSSAFYSGAYQEIHPLFILSLLNNVSFCQAAIEIDIRGENAVFSPHADAGAQAIAEGVRTLAEGKASVVLAGGVSEKITPQSLARAHLQGLLRLEDSLDAGGSRPFAADSDRTALGEGCGVLCLEPRASADQRGAPYRVAITGCGATFGIEANGAASADAIAGAMAKALDEAELGAADIDVVIAHGEGSRAGDQNEVEAVQRVFASVKKRFWLFCSKGALGHLLAGAPAVDAILAESILREQLLPPTLGSEPADSHAGFLLWSPTGKPVAPSTMPVGRNPEQEPPAKAGTRGEGSSRAQKVAARKILLNCRSSEGQCGSLVFESVS